MGFGQQVVDLSSGGAHLLDVLAEFLYEGVELVVAGLQLFLHSVYGLLLVLQQQLTDLLILRLQSAFTHHRHFLQENASMGQRPENTRNTQLRSGCFLNHKQFVDHKQTKCDHLYTKKTLSPTHPWLLLLPQTT